MAARTPVLADHRKVGSRLIAPFNDMFGPTRDVSWINTMIPELLWIALIQDVHGSRRGVEIITAFTRDVRASSADRSTEIWAAAGKFTAIPGEALRAIVTGSPENYADELRDALRPLAAWYPSHPLNALLAGETLDASADELTYLKRTVATLFDRSCKAAIMTQATAVWLAFDADRLKVAPDLSLAQFPRIEEYPETELSLRIAASIRASLNQFFGDTAIMASESDWPAAFWNRGLEIAPCEDYDGR
ncbi:MAG: hypothetical protein ABSA66_21650 [Roseiarcus sp.]|jgi:hypothetical protein